MVWNYQIREEIQVKQLGLTKQSDYGGQCTLQDQGGLANYRFILLRVN